MPPAIEPAHPYSLGLLITLVGRMLPFSLSIFFLIGPVRIIFGPADRRGRGCDGR